MIQVGSFRKWCVKGDPYPWKCQRKGSKTVIEHTTEGLTDQTILAILEHEAEQDVANKVAA